MLPAVLALATPPVAPVEVTYEPFAGLQVKVLGVPFVQGSGWQYFDARTRRGLYSSRWVPKDVSRLPDGTIRVRFQGANGQAVGTHDYAVTADSVTARYEFRWRGSGTVRLENTLGLLWGPALVGGRAEVGGIEAPVPARPMRGSEVDRRLGPPGGRFRFSSALADAEVTVQGPRSVVFDARGHRAEWAVDRSVFWLGHHSLIRPDETLAMKVTWRFSPRLAPLPEPREVFLEGRPLATALRAERDPVPLVPQPKERTDGLGTLRLGPGFAFEGRLAAEHPAVEAFLANLQHRWRLKTADLDDRPVTVRTVLEPTGLRPEGYDLLVEAGGVTLRAADDDGLRHGLQALVGLVRPQGDRLVLPLTRVRDWPSVGWRGVHMFVGPQAPAFQSRLLERVLLPLRFNRVVLQSERTEWATLPGVATAETMRRDDLVALFEHYRRHGLEPIPLIQSLGHMGWFFANGRNLDVALNRDLPFTIDPRRAAARDRLRTLWDEAFAVLSPKTVHFGLDEIDMRGLPRDPFFTTRLWTQHAPWLVGLAREKRAQPMVWGDIMLGPGEAIDATHAATVAEAKRRRAALPKGTTVADWHYRDEADPTKYTSLELWRREGFRPVAASWWRPRNVRGHTLAAIRAGAGTLQTTWAGFTSDERRMVAELRQFSAYVLAGEYAWSGRTEMPDRLGYDPTALLRRLFFLPPAALSDQPGRAWGPVDGARPARVTVGPVGFVPFAVPVRLYTPVSGEGRGGATEVTFRVGASAREVALALSTTSWMREGDAVAEVEIQLADGRVVRQTLAYGPHVRAADDARPPLVAQGDRGLTALRVTLSETDPVALVSVRVRSLDPAAGLVVHGLTTL